MDTLVLSGPTHDISILGGPTQPYNMHFYLKNWSKKLHYAYYSSEIRDFCFMKGSKIDETS